MGLTRKLQKVGHSLTVAVPAQLAGMFGLRAGDEMEFDRIGDWTLRLLKHRRRE